MKKLLLAGAAALSVLIADSIGSAWAYGTHLDWDCGNGVMIATSGKSGVYLYTSDPNTIVPITSTYNDKGELSFKIKWDFTKSKVWLNDKECHLMSDMDWYRRWCAEDPTNTEACEEVKLTDELIKQGLPDPEPEQLPSANPPSPQSDETVEEWCRKNDPYQLASCIELKKGLPKWLFK